MTDLHAIAEQLADSLVETVASAGYLPQNRTFSALEISDLKATLTEEIEAQLAQVAADARRETWEAAAKHAKKWSDQLMDNPDYSATKALVEMWLDFRARAQEPLPTEAK